MPSLTQQKERERAAGRAWTPGPWAFRQDCLTERDGCGYIVGADGDDLSHHGNTHRSIEENLANARLIAAAPELFEALVQAEIAVQELCNDQNPANECWNILRSIRASLSRATGEVDHG